MKIMIYVMNTTNYLVLLALLFLPITPSDWYGGDSLNIFVVISFILLTFSLLLLIVSQPEHKPIWKMSSLINTVNLVVLYPLLLFLLFFGIPFL